MNLQNATDRVSATGRALDTAAGSHRDARVLTVVTGIIEAFLVTLLVVARPASDGLVVVGLLSVVLHVASQVRVKLMEVRRDAADKRHFDALTEESSILRRQYRTIVQALELSAAARTTIPKPPPPFPSAPSAR